MRVLNLAANQIKCVENLLGLESLVELNLRRNEIEQMVILIFKLKRLITFHFIQNQNFGDPINLIQPIEVKSIDPNKIQYFDFWTLIFNKS